MSQQTLGSGRTPACTFAGHWMLDIWLSGNGMVLSEIWCPRKKSTNFGYFARRNWDKQNEYIKNIKKSFKNKTLDKNSIYYFSDKEIFNQYFKQVSLISKKIIIKDSNGLNHMLIIPNK